MAVSALALIGCESAETSTPVQKPQKPVRIEEKRTAMKAPSGPFSPTPANPPKRSRIAKATATHLIIKPRVRAALAAAYALR